MEIRFSKMLSTLIEARKSQGNRNVDFKFENILELIFAKKKLSRILSRQEKKLHIFIRNTKNWMMKNPKKIGTWRINLIQNLKKPLRITAMYLECCHLR